MTVSSGYIPSSAIGDGSIFVFSYAFTINDPIDLFVTVDNVTADPSEYTVDDILKTVSFAIPPVNLSIIVIGRKTPLTQLVDYIEGDNFPSDTHEGALDKLTLISQETADSNIRAIRYPDGDTNNPILPDVAGRANKFQAFDGSGNVVAVSGTGAGVNAVSATAPLSSTGGLAPDISYPQGQISSPGTAEPSKVLTTDSGNNVDGIIILGATTVNATTVNATTVNATTVGVTDVNATTINTSTVNSVLSGKANLDTGATSTPISTGASGLEIGTVSVVDAIRIYNNSSFSATLNYSINNGASNTQTVGAGGFYDISGLTVNQSIYLIFATTVSGPVLEMRGIVYRTTGGSVDLKVMWSGVSVV